MPEQKTSNRRQSRKQQPVDNTYAHLQPQALEVERAVLGALLIDKDAYAVVCETLRGIFRYSTALDERATCRCAHGGRGVSP